MEDIEKLINCAIEEDIGDGDHTSLACIPAQKNGSATVIAKQKGVLAGVEIAKKVCTLIDGDLYVDVHKPDGVEIKKGDKILTVKGKVRSILQAERLLLNFMQRMSGIATATREYAQLIEDLPCEVLDTRKTTPNMRVFEKMAVAIGGGTNHRFGLYDMIMIKDNHIDFAGGIKQAIERVNEYLKKNNKKLKIEIEVRNFDELRQVLEIGNVDRIMLDNFSVEDTRKAVKLIAHRYEVESSGGITFETIRQYAETGVDYVSVGALTHQIKSLDLSMKSDF